MTHSSLVGYNEPNRDRQQRQRRMAARKQSQSPTSYKVKRKRSYKDRCLKQLERYSQFVCKYDVALHTRYKSLCDAMYPAPSTADLTNAVRVSTTFYLVEWERYQMYHTSSVFRDVLTYKLYEALKTTIANKARGTQAIAVYAHHICVTLDEYDFNIQVSMCTISDAI